MDDWEYIAQPETTLNNPAAVAQEPKSEVECLLARGFWAPAIGADGKRELLFVLPAADLEPGLQKIIDAILRYVKEMDALTPFSSRTAVA